MFGKMKKALIIASVLIFVVGAAQQNLVPAQSQNQTQNYDWKKMTPEQRKELINKMSPEERMKLLKEFREDMMVSELDIPKENETEFRSLYSEYQSSQRQIKNKFQPKDNYESMSDDEAKNQLDQSFDVGQQLLNNRKEYCNRFMKIMKPQKVLKMYDTEGAIRNKVLDKKEHQSSNRTRGKR